MIAEGLLTVGVGFVSFFLGFLPNSDAPGWIVNGTGYLATAWSYAAGLGAWIPWPLVGTVLAAVMVCVLLGFGIKVARIIASYLTLGGGSAG